MDVNVIEKEFKSYSLPRLLKHGSVEKIPRIFLEAQKITFIQLGKNDAINSALKRVGSSVKSWRVRSRRMVFGPSHERDDISTSFWASVASWFLQPENSCLLTTMANSDQVSNTVSAISPVTSVKPEPESSKSEVSSSVTNGEVIIRTPTIATVRLYSFLFILNLQERIQLSSSLSFIA
ncbi:hypothetical protein WA026_008806 [Henosepilachna vigintioctopunctata]|uniref:Uncharacterized protein n=1 Tax=Henosepilachna vigintioctopunctata TaxID=420089 RepID=A0AAW1VDE5_9CUCU